MSKFLTFLLISFCILSYASSLPTFSQQEPAQWKTLDGLPSIFFGHGGEKFYLPGNFIRILETSIVQLHFFYPNFPQSIRLVLTDLQLLKVISEILKLLRTDLYLIIIQIRIKGAEYVEPDVVLTRDRVPVCFHDLALKRSTDVEDHPEFASLRGNHSVIIDGKNQTIVDDWLAIHFTLEEIKTLRVQQQPNGVGLQDFNSLYAISTFQEFLDTIHEISWKLGKPIGKLYKSYNTSATKMHTRIICDILYCIQE